MTLTSKSRDDLRYERRRVPHLSSVITVALLWPKRAQNVGTLLRTCDAVGARMVLPRTSDARFATTVGNTIGHIPDYCTFVDDPWLYLDWARDNSQIIGVELAHGATPIRDLQPAHKPVTLLLGHEVTGIPKVALEACDQIVEIPMEGMGNSLNVSVAGSLALYKLRGWI